MGNLALQDKLLSKITVVEMKYKRRIGGKTREIAYEMKESDMRLDRRKHWLV